MSLMGPELGLRVRPLPRHHVLAKAQLGKAQVGDPTRKTLTPSPLDFPVFLLHKMGDKGADDFWVASTGGKSSEKTTFKSSGKDDSARKVREGKKVQFEYDAQENGMFSTKSGGKGGFADGKGDKAKNGPKKTVVIKDTTPLELNVEEELPKNAKCMMDCEAATILDGIKDHMEHLSADATIKLPLSFDMALEYAKARSCFVEPNSVKQALQILRRHGASESEICMIANVHPETAEEVFGLIPSLKVKKNRLAEPLSTVLKELKKLKTKQDSHPL